MKLIPVLLMLLMSGQACSEIFKCEADNGKIVYQDIECRDRFKQSEVEISTVDPEKIQQAREKLDRDLQEWDSLQQSRAEEERKERELILKEQELKAKRDLVNATRNQTEAINQNTNATQNRSSGYRPYYYRRPGTRPDHTKNRKKNTEKPGNMKRKPTTKTSKVVVN